jgi:hypothetical protein
VPAEIAITDRHVWLCWRQGSPIVTQLVADAFNTYAAVPNPPSTAPVTPPTIRARWLATGGNATSGLTDDERVGATSANSA